MTPDDIDTITADARALSARRDEFTREFYATLFELDPDLRRLFPSDLSRQRGKLFEELNFLVRRATGEVSASAMSDFARRAGDLGGRHEVYGVTAGMYALVEIALLAALRATLDDFDDDHGRAWTRLYRLVQASMQRD